MSNGHIEIHDPMHEDCERKSTSDSNNMEGTPEFRLLMAFTTRRRQEKDSKSPSKEDPVQVRGGQVANGSPQAEDESTKIPEEKKKKKNRRKMSRKGLSRILSCFAPGKGAEEQTVRPEKPDFHHGGSFLSVEEEVEDWTKGAASKLTEIANQIPLVPADIPSVPPEIEADSPDDVEEVIGLLLREAGDQLNEEKKLQELVSRLMWNYGFFDTLVRTVLTRMSLLPSSHDTLGPQASQKTQIAVTCEVTSRLSAADTHPMNRLLGHGARYLQEHYSSWVQQQGGYEEAFYSEDEDDGK